MAETSRLRDVFYEAVTGMDVQGTRKLLQKDGRLINARYRWQQETALHTASKRGDIAMCHLLLEFGADKESVDVYNRTPFLLAAWNGHIRVMQFLKSAQCNVKARSKLYNGALGLASFHGHVPAVEFLLKSGHNVNEKHKDGMTPFLIAAQQGHVPLLKFLKAVQCNVEARDKDGNGALALASKWGRVEAVEFLIKNGHSVNEKYEDGSTALHIACRVFEIVSGSDHLSTVKLLVSAGADVPAVNNDGKSPQQIANERSAESGDGGEVAAFIVSWFRSLSDKGDSLQAIEHQDTGIQTNPVAETKQPKSAIDRLGPSAKADYLHALSKGKLRIARGYIDLFGEEYAGKSSVADSLMDQPFIEKRASTIGARIKVIRTAAGRDVDWDEIAAKGKDKFLDRQLARGFVTSSWRLSKDEAMEKMQGEVAQDDESHKASTKRRGRKMLVQAKSLQGSSDGAAFSTEKQATRREGSILRMGLRELVFPKELSEEKAAFIEVLKKDKEELRNCEELALITLCDRGGQEQFLMTHAAFMPDSSLYSLQGYMIVMDGMKSLNEPILECWFRPDKGGPVIRKKRHGPRTRRDLLGYYMSAIEMANPSTHFRPFLGQEYVKRAPITFALSTREDKVKIMDSRFAEEQEQILQEIVQKHEFGEHMVLAEKDPNKLMFRVDNTKSGTGTPDPIILKLKEMIVKMIRSVCDKLEEMPLSYAVLDQLLSRVAQLAGSDFKVLEIEEVYELAQQFCDIMTPRECQTALQYLSSFSSIAFYSNVSGLEKKVFIDLQWLVDALSVFVTVLDTSNLPQELWHHLKKLEDEGVMSWSLAHHLLDKKDVNESHFDSILKLLGLFDIICPSVNTLKAVEVGHSFFVPCMLSQEYTFPMAWQHSQCSSSTSFPPSLIFRNKKGGGGFPEPLYFRLVSRCVKQLTFLPPELKRDRAVFHLEFELDLELVYYNPTYIVATIFSVEDDCPVSDVDLRQQCINIRQLLVQQLNAAKVRGMDGFQFSVCVNPRLDCGQRTSDAGLVINSIDDDFLVCIDSYDPKKPALLNQKRQRVAHSRLPNLNLWFNSPLKEHQGFLRFKVDESAQTIPSHITALAEDIRSSSVHFGGFWEKWSDLPVDVVHQVCRLAAESPSELADRLHVSMMDIYSKPKADTPAQLVRQILEIWIQTEAKKATLDVLLRALERMKLLEALVTGLKSSV